MLAAQSVPEFGALLDDVADQYGLILTTERERARQDAVESRCLVGDESVADAVPGEQAMATNRQFLDHRLDDLRLVRRFSDASSVHIPACG